MLKICFRLNRLLPSKAIVQSIKFRWILLTRKIWKENRSIKKIGRDSRTDRDFTQAKILLLWLWREIRLQKEYIGNQLFKIGKVSQAIFWYNSSPMLRTILNLRILSRTKRLVSVQQIEITLSITQTEVQKQVQSVIRVSKGTWASISTQANLQLRILVWAKLVPRWPKNLTWKWLNQAQAARVIKAVKFISQPFWKAVVAQKKFKIW